MTTSTSSIAQNRKRRPWLWILLIPIICVACFGGLCRTITLGGSVDPVRVAATATPWNTAKWLKVAATDGSGSVQCHLNTDEATWSTPSQIISLPNGTELEVIGFGTAPVSWQNSSNNLYRVKVNQTGQTCYIRMELVTRIDKPTVPTANPAQVVVNQATAVTQNTPTPAPTPTPVTRQGLVSFQDDDGVNCHTDLNESTWQTAIIKLSTGDVVSIIGEATAPVSWNGSSDLYQVNTADGQTCYIRTELITVQP